MESIINEFDPLDPYELQREVLRLKTDPIGLFYSPKELAYHQARYHDACRAAETVYGLSGEYIPPSLDDIGI